MNHLPLLIQDLGLILIVAGITTLLFKRLNQPVVLGYILAGLLVGPKFPLLPTITEISNIQIWAEIGVVILLFTLGLEFSFKKLLHIGGPASITGLIEVSAMLAVGFVLGRLLGWPIMDCIFLGGILSIASTTIIIRAFDELEIKGKKFSNLVFGILIIEDLVAVVLLVLLSTIAVSREFAGIEMFNEIIKLVFFLMLWFIAGIFFIPTFLNRIQKYLNDETLLVIALALCLLMVILASKAGFSPALGAFVMGSILAETLHAERIEHTVKPIKDLFGAVFFVSVGMLIDPQVLIDYALPIVLITIVFVFFKVLHVTVGAVISGQPLKTALYAAMSMVQIGEFSFIIATLGVTLGVTSNYLYPIAVAVSAITTFSTPYMIKAAVPLYKKLEKVLPEKWLKTLERYSTGAQNINSASDWQKVLKSFIVICAFCIVFSVGIIYLFVGIESRLQALEYTDYLAVTFIAAAGCLLCVAPFLWALVRRKLQPVAFAKLWANKRYHGPLLVLRFVRIALAVGIVSAILITFLPIEYAFFMVIGIVVLALLFSKNIHKYYLRLEERFFFNFNRREIQEARATRRELAPWDAHISHYTVPVGSPFMGKALNELQLREQFGVNIAMIRRGNKHTVVAPLGAEKIYPGDKLFVIGNDDQLEQFSTALKQVYIPDNNTHPGKIVLKKVDLGEKSFLHEVPIKDSNIREMTNGLVVGIERDGKRILNPNSDTILLNGDRLWIVGQSDMIEKFRKA